MSKIDEPDPSIHRKMTAQAILADLLREAGLETGGQDDKTDK